MQHSVCGKSLSCYLFITGEITLLILGHGCKRPMPILALCLWNLVNTIQTTVFDQSRSDFTCNVLMITRNPIDFGSRSELTICLLNLLGTIQIRVLIYHFQIHIWNVHEWRWNLINIWSRVNVNFDHSVVCHFDYTAVAVSGKVKRA